MKYLKIPLPFIRKVVEKKLPAKGSTMPTGFNTFFIGDRQPIWINTQNLNDYARIVSENPVVYSVLDISARFFANGTVSIKDLNTGELITKNNMYSEDYRNNEILKKAFSLFEKPNPLMSRWEFLQTYLFMKHTYGNAFILAGVPIGRKVNIENVTSLWNVWPQWMNVVLKGQYFSATEISDIIAKWRFGYWNKELEFEPEQILHRRDVNIRLQSREDIIFGMSRLKPLQRPISNIAMSYESENIILQNRGARMVISPSQTGDDFSSIEPIGVNEKEELQNDFKDYGWLEGQNQAIISRRPIDVNVLDQDIRKLGLFESIATDGISVCNGFGVPEILLKLYLTGATFENQRQSVKRMYNSTTIPEFNDFVNDLNHWLKLPDYGYEYVSDFSHVPDLKEDLRDEAISRRQISSYMMEQFKSGACTYNEWRRGLGQTEEPWGDVRIFELAPEQLAILGINIPEGKTNEPKYLKIKS